jgi:hypothetical protein
MNIYVKSISADSTAAMSVPEARIVRQLCASFDTGGRRRGKLVTAFSIC